LQHRVADIVHPLSDYKFGVGDENKGSGLIVIRRQI
jgi:hypothetical protein